MGNKPKLEHESVDRIITTAWELFQRKGFRGVSVDEICERCNLTKPTLYYHFHDKEGLFVTVLQHQLTHFHESLPEDGSIQDRLLGFASAIFENFQSETTTLLHDREHIQKPQNQFLIRDAFRGLLFNPLLALMQTGLDSGELHGRNAEFLTLMFLGIINNFISRANEISPDRKSLAAELTSLFLQGVSTK
jgi:AcrR family transcriptional regulator